MPLVPLRDPHGGILGGLADSPTVPLWLARVSDALRDDWHRTRRQLAERTQEAALLSAEVAALRAELRHSTARYEEMANELERLRVLLRARDQK